VTFEVISSIADRLLTGNIERIWTRGLTGEGAWEYFLRGVSHFYKLTKHDNAAAREMFSKLYHLHPDKSIGPGYIAFSHWFDAMRGWAESPADSLEQARDWAEKSIKTEDENNGLGHVILGSIWLREGRHDEGLAMCRKGVAFRSGCPFALGQLADAQLYCGDAQGAIKSARESLSVRMLYPPPLVNILATAYRDGGKVDLSISAAREAARLDPHHTNAFVTLCSDFILAGLDEEALRMASQIVELDPKFSVSEFAKNLPYKDSTKIANIAEILRSAGLPG